MATPLFEVLTTGPFDRRNVAVRYDPGDRIVRAQDEQDLIGQTWIDAVTRARQLGTPMFNGKLFRLKDWKADAGILVLGLGDTDYREYVGTRAPTFHRGRQRSELANPLAVCVALVTRDGQVLVERRQHVDVYAGRYHVIGGFVDRDLDLPGARPDPADAVQRELAEETGVTCDDASLRTLGLVYDVATPHPELCFAGSTALSLADVKHRHGAKDHSEVVQLEGVGVSDKSIHDFLSEHRHGVSATGAGCLALLGRELYGERWYREVLLALAA